MFDRTKADPRLGLKLGLATAAVMSGIGLVLYLIDGPARFETSGLSFPAVVAAYFAAGVVGGPLFGLSLPLTKSRAGSSVVGAGVAATAYLGVTQLVGSDLGSSVVAAMLVGAVVGAALWTPVQQASPEDSSGA